MEDPAQIISEGNNPKRLLCEQLEFFVASGEYPDACSDGEKYGKKKDN
jgi:hypothetical protein